MHKFRQEVFKLLIGLPLFIKLWKIWIFLFSSRSHTISYHMYKHIMPWNYSKSRLKSIEGCWISLNAFWKVEYVGWQLVGLELTVIWWHYFTLPTVLRLYLHLFWVMFLFCLNEVPVMMLSMQCGFCIV